MNDKQHELNIALDDAVNRGDLSEVRELIKQGANIEYRDTFGNTPLMNSAWVAATDVLTYLVNLGANLFAKNDEGQTALDLAKSVGHNKYGHSDIMNILETKMNC